MPGEPGLTHQPGACCLLLHVVQALCRAAGEVVDAMLKAVNKDPEDEPPLDVVAGLYSDKTAGGWVAGDSRPLVCVCFAKLPKRLAVLDRLRRRGCNFRYCLLTIRQGVAPASPATALGCAGKDWSLDADFEGAGQQVQRGYLGMLSVDSLLAFMGSVEKLVDIAVEQGGQVPLALSKGPGSGGRAGAWAALGSQ